MNSETNRALTEPGGPRAASLPSPFYNIVRLSAGDLLAKTLNLLAFVYLARVLGVQRFGVLEFAKALLAYFLLLADAGVEAWATRAAAQMQDMRRLAGRVLPLRLLLAGLAFLLLLALLPFLPDSQIGLRLIAALYGLSLFPQAVTLKWVFMGQEKMARVAAGLALTQAIFAAAVVGVVRRPEAFVWVPVLRFAADIVMAVYFARLFAATHGRLRLPFTMQGAREILRPAIAMGSSAAMEMVNYNFDSILLGYLTGAVAVGLYNAAYIPVNTVLAVAANFFLGMFPALARTWGEGPEGFAQLVRRSLQLCAIYVIPFGIGGTLLAAPIIRLLFGAAYIHSVAPLQILIWSAVAMILYGTYSTALKASHHHDLDLRCGLVSAALNVALNFLWIPRYGMMGAAWATLCANLLWLLLAWFFFHRRVLPASPLPFLLRPGLAGAAMVLTLLVLGPVFWVARAVLAVAVYFGALLLLREPEVWAWFRAARRQAS